MPEPGRELAERLHREAVERVLAPSAVSVDACLPEGAPDSPVAPEWDLYRREVPRLLADGHRHRFALVKTGHPITVWDTLRDALQAARLLYGTAACLVQEILPYLRAQRRRERRPCRA